MSSQLEWLDNPEVVVFAASEDALALGAADRHGIRATLGGLFGRAAEDVKADLDKTIEQMKSFLTDLSPSAHGYLVDEVAFQLGFSAQGRVAFIAEAGVTSSITVTFKRSPADDDELPAPDSAAV
jgi:hypothetical protein